MIVRAVELRLVGVPLVRPFRTSFGETNRKECVLVRVETDSAEGWGECVADIEPDFSGEFNAGVQVLIRDTLAPALFRAGEVTSAELADLFAFVRGNPMAKGAVIDAVLDAELKSQGRSLASYLGSERDRVACGVSVGITPTTDELLAQVDGYLADGYQRIKLKIAPGVDVERVAAVRAAHPDILLSVDANAAYRLADIDIFKALEDLDLLMIEQPLHYEDIVQHAKLQAELRTDLCLDESIRSPADA
ncbi:MAG: o-succinylbenzoate synthase, partial [Actinomycetota bacterium]|nr:o-succinylbenzoate synthase [Actinomycetota bacterium]